jgi:hypothetical protein
VPKFPSLKLASGLLQEESKVFRLHLMYQLIEGVILGVLALNEYVFIKSIKGSGYQLSFLFQFSMIVFVFLVFFNELRKRIKNKRWLLRLAGLVTRLPLGLLIFFPKSPSAYDGNSIYHYIFLFIFLFYYFGNIIIYPAINVLLKTNYRHENFGKLYSYTSSLNKLVMLVTTFFYGIILDIDNYAFVYVFPVMAVLGVFSLYILSYIDYSKVTQAPGTGSILQSVKVSASNMWNILKKNRPYLHFEVGFMFYGFAFMITSPVINIFFDEGLHLNYSSVAFYKNSYNLLAIFLLFYTGKLLGKMDPRKFASITFASLLFYILFLALTEFIPFHTNLRGIELYPTLLIAFTFNGVFAATMVLLWNIGSAYFCLPEEADDYQSVHLFLTGVRSIFAPILGVFFYEIIGFTGAFGIAILSLMVAIFIMRRSYIRQHSLV